MDVKLSCWVSVAVVSIETGLSQAVCPPKWLEFLRKRRLADVALDRDCPVLAHRLRVFVIARCATVRRDPSSAVPGDDMGRARRAFIVVAVMCASIAAQKSASSSSSYPKIIDRHHRVEVKLKVKAGKVTARRGYFAE